jgi:hypothetical protein
MRIGIDAKGATGFGRLLSECISATSTRVTNSDAVTPSTLLTISQTAKEKAARTLSSDSATPVDADFRELVQTILASILRITQDQSTQDGVELPIILAENTRGDTSSGELDSSFIAMSVIQLLNCQLSPA